MNNKGQILPIFIILFPIIILMISYIVDIGLMYIEKRKIENTVKDAIIYYIDNITDEDIYNKTSELINKNIENVNVNIESADEHITISIIKKHKSIYSILNLNDEIRVKYTGYFIDKRIVKG